MTKRYPSSSDCYGSDTRFLSDHLITATAVTVINDLLQNTTSFLWQSFYSHIIEEQKLGFPGSLHGLNHYSKQVQKSLQYITHFLGRAVKFSRGKLLYLPRGQLKLPGFCFVWFFFLKPDNVGFSLNAKRQWHFLYLYDFVTAEWDGAQ